MGFFSDFFDWVGDRIDDVRDAVADTLVDTIEGIIDTGDTLFGNVSQEKAYDSNVSSVSDTERLNELLTSFSEASLQRSEEIEAQCIRTVEDYCDTLIAFLEESSSIAKDRAGMRRVKRNRDKIKASISGSIKEPLAKKMSLDDPECRKILKLDSGTEKKDRMKEFSDKAIQEALDNLAGKVRDVLDEQSEGIEDFFSSYAESQEREMENIKQQYDAMLQDGDAEASDIERRCMDPLVTIKTAELVEGML